MSDTSAFTDTQYAPERDAANIIHNVQDQLLCKTDSDCQDALQEQHPLAKENGCMVAICNPVPDTVGGICDFVTLDGAPCDDNNPCTVNDACNDLAQCGGEFLAHAPCDDGDPCTENDECVGINSATDCEGTPVVCIPDGKECHTIQCDPQTGQCVTTDLPNEVCDDDNTCTIDFCDGVTADCVHLPENDGTPCDDHEQCTKQDQCVQGNCEGTPSLTTFVAVSGAELPKSIQVADIRNECWETAPAGLIETGPCQVPLDFKNGAPCDTPTALCWWTQNSVTLCLETNVFYTEGWKTTGTCTVADGMEGCFPAEKDLCTEPFADQLTFNGEASCLVDGKNTPVCWSEPYMTMVPCDTL